MSFVVSVASLLVSLVVVGPLVAVETIGGGINGGSSSLSSTNKYLYIP